MKKYLIAISLAALAALWFFNKGKEITEDKNTIKIQEKQIEKKDEIIEVKKFQQKIIKQTPVNDTVNDRREFLQFIFEERDHTDR